MQIAQRKPVGFAKPQPIQKLMDRDGVRRNPASGQLRRLQDTYSEFTIAIMAEVSFVAARLNKVTPIGFSDGWVVIRHESGQMDSFASSPFATEAEARAEVDRIIAHMSAKNS
jgi:hypothetical protein